MFDGAFVVVDQFGVLRGNFTLIPKELALYLVRTLRQSLSLSRQDAAQ